MKTLSVTILLALAILVVELPPTHAYQFLHDDATNNGSICKQGNPMQLTYYIGGLAYPYNWIAPMAVEAWNDMPAMFYFSQLLSPSAQQTVSIQNVHDPDYRFNGRQQYDAVTFTASDANFLLDCANGFASGSEAIYLNDHDIAGQSSKFYLSTIGHELGHVLGLADFGNATGDACTYQALMYGFRNRITQCHIYVPVDDDIKGAVQLYGWAGDTGFGGQESTGGGVSSYNFLPPINLYAATGGHHYSRAMGSTTLPSSNIAIMMAYVTPHTLYRFHVGWKTSGSFDNTEYAVIELDDDGFKFVSNSNGHTIANFASSPSVDVSYFLELIVYGGQLGLGVVAYAYRTTTVSDINPDGGSNYLGWYDPSSSVVGSWSAAQGAEVAVWTDNANNPGSNYDVNHFWDFNGVASAKVSAGGFGISASTGSLIIAPGTSANSQITLTSLSGLIGYVDLSGSASPVANRPTVSFIPLTVPLTSGGSATSTATIAVPPTAVLGSTYTITITGSIGTISRSQTITVLVATPDFTISANPTSFVVHWAQWGTSTITVQSINNLAGTVNLSVRGGPWIAGTGNIYAAVSPTSLTLSAGQSLTSTLQVNAFSTSTPGTYSIIVDASYSYSGGTISHSTTVTITLNNCCY